MEHACYIAIDLKSFYASVECRERGLNPLKTHLVVANAARTEKTICLAVSPALKAYGISGRARLFEVMQQIDKINVARKKHAPGGVLTGAALQADDLQNHPDWAIDYIIAPPQMARYIQYSTQIYDLYLRYVAPEDIFAYSIDEVFIDATNYLHGKHTSAYEFARKLVQTVLEEMGITATAGIGTNLYLAKVAMDIVAKHIPPDHDGVRIAALDVETYRHTLWTHRPLTDFWRVGHGTAEKLEANGIYTMGDIARCSLGKPQDYYNADLLYQLFGVNAELLIDHAWGDEPCTIADVKSYVPEQNSISSGQVLKSPYSAENARIIVREMADALAMDLLRQCLVTDQIVLTVGYDVENLTNPDFAKHYHGKIVTDHYGRRIPQHAHGTEQLDSPTASTRTIVTAALALYDRIIHPALLIRRITIAANHVISEQSLSDSEQSLEAIQLPLFGEDAPASNATRMAENSTQQREKRVQQTILNIQERFGKNAILKGTSLQELANARERNQQIGGHKA